jgi:hypothetical protein
MKNGRLGCWRPEEPGMNKENQDRGALIDRMLEVRSDQEVEAAEKDAEGRLEVNPDAVRVIAASERLVKTGARTQDTELGAKRLSLSVFALVFSSVALAAGALTDSFYAALAAGVLVALPLTEFVWGLLHHRYVDAASLDGER